MLYDVLEKLGIVYEEIEHQPIYTIEDAKNIENRIDGIGCKNLFLTDGHKYYLVVLRSDKRANLKEIEKILESPHVHFASIEELSLVLKLEKGSVTPFGIINDMENRVTVLLDKDLEGEKLLFHPNINTRTISVLYDDLIRFIQYKSHKLKIERL